ncbi:hypothetical protein, partial [Ralstonia solanacearum]|uniref:hypothetical protein n=2 Tax=Ralstonia TaxID=48736 RepID=UPI001C2F9856
LRDQRLQRQPQLFADFSSRHASYDNPLLAVGQVVLVALNQTSSDPGQYFIFMHEFRHNSSENRAMDLSRVSAGPIKMAEALIIALRNR